MSDNNVEPGRDLLTYQQLAKLLNLPAGTLYALVHEGRIPHIRLGKRLVRFVREDVDRWLAEHSVGDRKQVA